MDLDRLREIVVGIPRGHWISYGDLAAAAGGNEAHARTLNQRFIREALDGRSPGPEVRRHDRRHRPRRPRRGAPPARGGGPRVRRRPRHALATHPPAGVAATRAVARRSPRQPRRRNRTARSRRRRDHHDDHDDGPRAPGPSPAAALGTRPPPRRRGAAPAGPVSRAASCLRHAARRRACPGRAAHRRARLGPGRYVHRGVVHQRVDLRVGAVPVGSVLRVGELVRRPGRQHGGRDLDSPGEHRGLDVHGTGRHGDRRVPDLARPTAWRPTSRSGRAW